MDTVTILATFKGILLWLLHPGILYVLIYMLIGFLLSALLWRAYKYFINKQAKKDLLLFKPELKTVGVNLYTYDNIGDKFVVGTNARPRPSFESVISFEDYLNTITDVENRNFTVIIWLWPLVLVWFAVFNLLCLVPTVTKLFGNWLYGKPIKK